MKPIEWERRQTQPKAKQQTKATHSGNAQDAFPEVFLASVHACLAMVANCVRDALSVYAGVHDAQTMDRG
jgi:hypothetical protein